MSPLWELSAVEEGDWSSESVDEYEALGESRVEPAPLDELGRPSSHLKIRSAPPAKETVRTESSELD